MRGGLNDALSILLHEGFDRQHALAVVMGHAIDATEHHLVAHMRNAEGVFVETGDFCRLDGAVHAYAAIDATFFDCRLISFEQFSQHLRTMPPESQAITYDYIGNGESLTMN